LLAGGVLQYGYQCGMIWGASLTAGKQAHGRFGPGPQAETAAINAARKLVESFRAQNHNINCADITDLDKSSSVMKMVTFFLLKGGVFGCWRRAARYAPQAFNEIEPVLRANQGEIPPRPVSCAAELARRMGASELHATMASGWAGGIGLCGGGCGALGCAMWILGTKRLQEPGGKIEFKDPQAAKLVDRFHKCSGFKFECAEIVGRKFENVGDHAAYLQSGGCAELMNVLAAT